MIRRLRSLQQKPEDRKTAKALREHPFITTRAATTEEVSAWLATLPAVPPPASGSAADLTELDEEMSSS